MFSKILKNKEIRNILLIFSVGMIFLYILTILYKKFSNKEGFEGQTEEMRLDTSDPINPKLVIDKIEVKTNQVEEDIEKCKSLKSCDDLQNTKCGICLDTNEIMYGDENGPIANVCLASDGKPGRWVKEASACKKAKERDICSKVNSCNTMTGEASICGWCPTSRKAFVSKMENGVLVPKYSEDTCLTSGIFGEKKPSNLYDNNSCSLAGEEYPCTGPNEETGPHSMKCLNKLWMDIGGSTSGTNAPKNANQEQLARWNSLGVKNVLSDMRRMKANADSNVWNIAKNYYKKVYGTEPDPCSDNFIIKPVQCYQKKFVEFGCKQEGSMYPRKEQSMTIDQYRVAIKNMINDSHNQYLSFKDRNAAYQKCYGGSLTDLAKANSPNEQQVNLSQGLNAYVYENTSSTGQIGRPLNSQPQKIDNVNFWWGSGNVLSQYKDKVYVVIEGYIVYPPKAANVVYRLGSDDGSRLYLGGKQIIDNWGLHGFKWVNSEMMPVSKQVENLKIEMFEWGGGASLKLEWNINNEGWKKIPDEAFKSAILRDQKVYLNPKGYKLVGSGINLPNGIANVQDIKLENDLVVYIAPNGGNNVAVVKAPYSGRNQRGYTYKGTVADYGRAKLYELPSGSIRATGTSDVPLTFTPKYLGCYRDKRSRAMPYLITRKGTFNQIMRMAKQKGYKYVGLQYANGFNKQYAEAWGSNSNDYDKYGRAECTKLTSGEISGISWSNAVYQI